MSCRIIKRGALILLVLLSLFGAYGVGVYHGSRAGTQQDYERGYRQGASDTIHALTSQQTIPQVKPPRDVNRLFLQS